MCPQTCFKVKEISVLANSSLQVRLNAISRLSWKKITGLSSWSELWGKKRGVCITGCFEVNSNRGESGWRACYNSAIVDMWGHVEKGVSGIKHFYWVGPSYLFTMQRDYLHLFIKKRQLIRKASSVWAAWVSLSVFPLLKQLRVIRKLKSISPKTQKWRSTNVSKFGSVHPLQNSISQFMLFCIKKIKDVLHN